MSVLRHDGVAAGFAADLAPDVTALDANAQRTFESRSNMVAGVQLERAGTVDAIVAAIESAKTALLGGPSGYGKSAVLREVYAQLAADGPVLHLSGRRIATSGSWAALADDMGIPHDRARLAEVLGANERGATVVLDALEHVQTAGARAVVNDLLRDLQTRCGTVNVMLTTRDLLVADVLRWLDATAIRPLERVTLDTLDPADAIRIAEAAPALRALLARVAGNRIPGGILVLELLRDARVPPAALAATPATEADLLDVWWDHIVLGNDADRHARRAVARAAADAVVHASGALFQLPNGLDGNAIAALDVDGVLVLDVQLDAYRFGHDIIQDWAIVRWIDSAETDAVAHVTALAQAPGFYRCVALFAQRLAEREPERYYAFLRRLENAGDTRGVQAFLSALALSPHAQALLIARADMLLEHGAARLAELLNVLRTEQVQINVNVVDYARGRGMDIGSAILGGVMHGTPRFIVWAAALRFCVAHLDALARATLPFVQMADRWQQTTPPGFALRADLFATTMRILAQLERWRRREAELSTITIRYEDEASIEKAARSAAAHAADVDPAAMARYLEDLREHGYGDAQDNMLGHAGAVGCALTDEVVAYVVAVLCERDRRRPWERDFSELGLRPHKYYPASDLQGPFLALLRSNEAAGLAVVRELAARALAHYERKVEAGRFSEPAHLRSLTFSFRGRTVTPRGDERVYTWFRPGTSDDSAVLTSALMALDTWAIESIRNGRDPDEIADLLLTDTECIAVLGIVVGLAYDAPALASELVDVVGQPWLWRLEFFRGRRDAMPDDVNALLPAEWRMPTLRPDLRNRNRARDAERSRDRHLARFAVTCLFLSDAAIRQAFVDRTTAAQLANACLYVEEAAHAGDSPVAQEDLELFQAFVNPDNYENTEFEAALRADNGGVPDDLLAMYEAAEHDAALGPLPDVRACSAMAMYRLERVLPALPDTFTGAETLDVLVAIAQQLLAIARGEETEDDRQFRFSFARQVGRFAADVFVALPADEYAAFRASVTDWAASLDVFREAVLGIIYRHVAMYEMAENTVERFCALRSRS